MLSFVVSTAKSCATLTAYRIYLVDEHDTGLMLFSLFWKRINRAGAIAGMVGGAGMVFLWKLVISQLGGVFAIYELLPAFVFSGVCIVVVSLLTKAPDEAVLADFEAVKTGNM